MTVKHDKMKSDFKRKSERRYWKQGKQRNGLNNVLDTAQILQG